MIRMPGFGLPKRANGSLMRRDPQRAIEDREMIDRVLDMVVGAGG
jgi:hypothetical protein